MLLLVLLTWPNHFRRDYIILPPIGSTTLILYTFNLDLLLYVRSPTATTCNTVKHYITLCNKSEKHILITNNAFIHLGWVPQFTCPSVSLSPCTMYLGCLNCVTHVIVWSFSFHTKVSTSTHLATLAFYIISNEYFESIQVWFSYIQ